MPMLCKVAAPFSDVVCPTCGQGFLVYGLGSWRGERSERQRLLGAILQEQHSITSRAEVHAPAFELAQALRPQPEARPMASISPAMPAFS